MLKTSILFVFILTQEEKLHDKAWIWALQLAAAFVRRDGFPEDIIESHLDHAMALTF